jgi:hypothetical protein
MESNPTPGLTAENYHDKAWQHLLTPSQLKDFLACEFGWLHEYRLNTEPPIKEKLSWQSPLVVGQCVDIILTQPAKLDAFLTQYLPMNAKKEPFAGYTQALACAEAVKKHAMAASLLAGGQFQQVKTGMVFGVPAKAMPDLIVNGAIWDLKTCADLDGCEYSVEIGRYVPFWFDRKYHWQAKFYSMVFELPAEGLILVDKDKLPMVETAMWDPATLEQAEIDLKRAAKLFAEGSEVVTLDPAEARRCNRCMWCRAFPAVIDYHSRTLELPKTWKD